MQDAPRRGAVASARRYGHAVKNGILSPPGVAPTAPVRYHRAMIRLRVTAWAAAGLLGGTMWAGLEAWPQFRGPRGDGTSKATNVPLHWSETTNVAWKVALPGRGRSSPVLDRGRIWLTTALETGVQRTRIGPDDMQTAERVVLKALCVEAETGRVIWDTQLFDVPQPDPVHWLNSWATPTPVVQGDRLYCDFGTFGTACLDADTGRVVWQKRIANDHQVGPGSSPVLDRDRLILVRDGREAQFVVALDQRTGDQVWKTDRPPINASSPNLKKSFATPLLVHAAGGDQLVAPGAHWVAAYDPATGNELWRLRHGDGFSIGTAPVAFDDVVVFGTGCFKPQMVAARLSGRGDVTSSNLVWRSLKQVPVMSSPVLAGNWIHWVSDEGMVTCAERATGEVVWQERLGRSHLASPLLAEGRLFLFAQDGHATVLSPGPQFTRLAENSLEGTLIATPAVVSGNLYIRTDTHLYRVATEPTEH